MLRLENGTAYGPVTRAELDKWVEEGRVTAKSQVGQTHSDVWQNAAELYPWLRPAEASVGPSPPAKNPFADAPVSGSFNNPYSSPVGGARPVLPAHRGGLVLALGIIGVLFCNLLGPFAWAMGQNDLRAMRQNQMDPGGMGMTQAGMILGIIATCFFAFGCIIGMIMVLAASFG